MNERTVGQRAPADRRIDVLVVDDSKVLRMLLARIIDSDPRLRVIGSVGNGHGALEFIGRHVPDAILMDINMPGMDGFEATRRIMESHPVPIIICSATTDPSAVATTFRALEAGALACVEKPVSLEHPEFPQQAAALLETVRLMSEVKVVRRWARARVQPPAVASTSARGASPQIEVVGIGASTGGPQVLQQILASLPKSFPVPVLIVQHISHGFLPGLTQWLNQTVGFQCHIAASGLVPLPGHVYLAPDDFHMGLNSAGRILLTREAPEHQIRPAVSHLFRSLATVSGPLAIGVLLTGMGRDGAAELKLMKDAGATTIAQDRESSVVHGMPGAAIELGAATHVLGADRIADMLLALVKQRNSGGRST